MVSNLYAEMTFISQRSKFLPNVRLCTLVSRQLSNKYFIRLEMNSGNTYGISYVFKEKKFVIWDYFGESRDYSEQHRIKFDSSVQLVEFLRSTNLDSAFKYLEDNKIFDQPWSTYDRQELDDLWGEVVHEPIPGAFSIAPHKDEENETKTEKRKDQKDCV